ncbi:MAG: putative sulfate exporter family transporter [Opitutae bacterium]|nr:putative sulfate exporter family transporter [Opitutae bacterium]
MPEATPKWKIALFWGLAAACALPWITPPLALFAGLVFAFVIGRADPGRAAKVQKFLLQASVVGLGFGIQFGAVVQAGSTGLAITAASLVATMGLGLLLAHWLQVGQTTGRLISTGTAICGGSAIAAMGPVLGAAAGEMSVALGCVFVLNAVALFVFPAIGHALHLAPVQFGYWAAIAIHDTSSVVGAAARYSPEALAVAVPVKLARALWILPMVAVAAMLVRKPGGKTVVPWFIFLFVAASALASFVPVGAPAYPWLVQAAKAGLAVTLFLIGAGLSRESLKSVGWRPFAQGVALWVVVSLVSLWAVRQWVR